MSSFMLCFYSFIAWHCSIEDCALAGNQTVSAKANARLERMAKFACVRMLSTAASSLALRHGAVSHGQKLCQALAAAKVERLSIAIGVGVESGCFVYSHSTNWINGFGFLF